MFALTGYGLFHCVHAVFTKQELLSFVNECRRTYSAEYIMGRNPSYVFWVGPYVDVFVPTSDHEVKLDFIITVLEIVTVRNVQHLQWHICGLLVCVLYYTF